MEIKINTVGKILTGHQAGWYVKIQDDREDSGGFLILTAESSEWNGKGFDNWVEDEDSLQKFFIQAGWTILWL